MSDHDYHHVHEGCTRCGALPGESIECAPKPIGRYNGRDVYGITWHPPMPDGKQWARLVLSNGVEFAPASALAAEGFFPWEAQK